MNLIADIGNTRTKIAVFDGDMIVEQWTVGDVDKEMVRNIIGKYSIEKAIISAVGKGVNCGEVFSDIPRCLELSSQLRLPIKNNYKTPNTLGGDRLAAAVGATVLTPNQNNLIIDAGTCITIDFVTKENEYMGGAIMPGILMKFKALHTFTDKLPLLSFDNSEKIDVIGNDTRSSMISGVVNGTCFEIEGFVDRYMTDFGNMNIIFTGGDAVYFEKRIKFPNFISSNLLLIGLNKILNYNE